MEYIKTEDAESALRLAAESLNRDIAENSEKGILLMLSGGSSLKLLPLINTGLLDLRVTITVLDERFSNDPKINNFAQISQTDFYRIAKDRGVNFIDTRLINNESIEELARRFDDGLRNWRKSSAGGKIIATLGIGSDGHIAGIMSFPEDTRTFEELFMYDEHWIVGYDAGNKNPYPLRITPTVPFLRDQIDFGIVYVVGEDKTDALKRILSEEGSLSETPARALREMKSAIIYTDITVEP